MNYVELHLHLEGAVSAGVLIESAKRFGYKHLPTLDIHQLEKELVSENINEFFKVWDILRPFWNREENFLYFTKSMFKDASKADVKYIEFRWGPWGAVKQGVDPWNSLEEIRKGMNSAFEKYGIYSNLIAGIQRGFPEFATDTTKFIVQAFEKGLIAGADVFGDERNYPLELYDKELRMIKDAGIPMTIHAGEWAGVDSIKSALKYGAKRIGHGIAGIYDDELLSIICEKDIMLEICPTSNLRTGVIKNLTELNLNKLLQKGVKFCINSDDPVLFDSDIKKEYNLIKDTFNLSKEQINELNISALNSSFATSAQKEAILKEII